MRLARGDWGAAIVEFRRPDPNPRVPGQGGSRSLASGHRKGGHHGAHAVGDSAGDSGLEHVKAAFGEALEADDDVLPPPPPSLMWRQCWN
jgi:hypothetical protein